jgi:hypothetical protein
VRAVVVRAAVGEWTASESIGDASPAITVSIGRSFAY